MNPKRRCRRNVEKEITADLDSQRFNSTCIPDDVIAEILSRLPIKSIGRFTSVSKSWRDLLTSRSFSSMRAKNYPFSTFYATSEYFDWRGKSRIVDVSETGEYVRTTLRPRVRGLSGSRVMEIVGSCNGLMCYLERRRDDEVITILNPVTNETTVITLPNHGDWIVGSRREEEAAKRCYRFGYSPSTNEYKVFKGLRIVRGVEARNSYAVFTVGVDRRWRDLPRDPHLFPVTWVYWDALCNGAFHWLVVRYGDDDPRHGYIVSLDIARESARRISIPRQRNQWQWKLLVLNNRICLCLRRSYLWSGHEGNTVIWKMEGCEDNYYWSQIVVPKVGSLSGPRDDIFAPVNFATKYGGILFRGGRSGRLSLYCPEQMRDTEIHIPCERDTGLLFEFSPSFLSIDEIVHGKIEQ